MKLRAAHKIASAVEDSIRCRLDNVYDIMVHVEPNDENPNTSKEHEGYGLSEAEI
jgi:divalent metal cation (Fe/Co/Zn/Cd) transporter